MSEIRKITQVFYPREEAAVKAANQNLNRDFRKGLRKEKSLSDFKDPVASHEYLHNTMYTLICDGQNCLPEYPDTEHICVIPEPEEGEKDVQQQEA